MGQVYGSHLQRGGCFVGVYVRPARVSQARSGYPLHQLRLMAAVRQHSFVPDAVHSSESDVASRRYDVLWLCLPSEALQQSWLRPLLDAAPDATVVCQTPGPTDGPRIASWAGPERLVEGAIQMAAYGVSLEDTLGEGMRYFLLPVAQPLSGDPARVAALVRACRAGGLRARHQRHAGDAYRASGATMLPIMGALELSRWSFRALAVGDALELGCRAARQALGVHAAETGKRGWMAWGVRPRLVRLAFAAAARLAPFPVEKFFGYHFHKVRTQTRLLLERYAQQAQQRQLPCDALQQLYARLQEPEPAREPPHAEPATRNG